MILAKKPGSNPRVVALHSSSDVVERYGIQTHTAFREAFNELRAITKGEIKEFISDEEIEEMGIRLLQLFSVLTTTEPVPAGDKPTEQEQKALAFLQDEISRGRSPSIRELCKAMGLRSSRLGFRLLNGLIARGWVYRDGKGALK